jgi:heat shock protein HspQ
MQFDNNTTRSVADAVTRILSGQPVSEELKGDQHKIDANKNNKIDAHDFELLRKKKKVEEETVDSKKKDDPPFDADPVKKKPSAVAGKFGMGYSTAKHLAQQGMKKAMKKEETELTESHFKVGDKVKCKSSGMKGEVVKLDKDHGEDDEKYYTVKREDGQMKKMAPEDMTKINEDVEQIDEYDSNKQGVYKHKGTYGSAKGAEYGATDYKKENELAKAADKEKKAPARKAYGARQNFVRSYAKESFTGLLDVYRQGGIKSLQEALLEEPDNEQFTKEVERQKRKDAGTAPESEKAKVAKASVQAVKVEEDIQDIHVISVDKANGVEMIDIEEDFEQIDELSKPTLASYAKKATKDARMTQSLGKEFDAKADKSRKPSMKDAAQSLADKYKSKSRSREAGVGKAVDRLAKEEVANIQERSLSEPEMKKKEEVVKSMKKNLSGFKDRYGDDAKSVMYATATKIAKKD